MSAPRSVTANFNYTLTYIFYGFFSPVDNLPIVNVANAGQAIPVKWRLTDSNGVPISDPSSFKSLTSYGVTTLATKKVTIYTEILLSCEYRVEQNLLPRVHLRNIQPAWQSLKLLTRRYLNSGQGNNCDTLSGEPTSAVDEYAAGSSGLQYSGNGYWQFNWKTPKTYAKQCRTMVLTLSA